MSEDKRDAEQAMQDLREMKITVHGIDADPIEERLLALVRAKGFAYLHRASEGDGWTVTRSAIPDDPISPETLLLRAVAPSTPGADLTAEEIAELRRLATLEANEPSSAASDVLLTPNGERIVASLLVDHRLLPLLGEVERRRMLDWRVQALLQRIEWAAIRTQAGGDPDYDTAPACPECDALKSRQPHEPGCEFAAVLTQLQADKAT